MNNLQPLSFSSIFNTANLLYGMLSVETNTQRVPISSTACKTIYCVPNVLKLHVRRFHVLFNWLKLIWYAFSTVSVTQSWWLIRFFSNFTYAYGVSFQPHTSLLKPHSIHFTSWEFKFKSTIDDSHSSILCLALRMENNTCQIAELFENRTNWPH